MAPGAMKPPMLSATLSVPAPEIEFFIDNLLVRIHFIIEMIRWTGLAPWATRWSTTRSSEINLPQIINFRALCSANLVT